MRPLNCLTVSQIIYRTSQPNDLWHPASQKNRTGRYARFRTHPKEKVVDQDENDLNSNTWMESGHTELQTTQPQTIYATVSNGDNGIIHVGAENGDKGIIHVAAENGVKGIIHVGAENKSYDHEGDRNSLDDESAPQNDGGHQTQL